MLVLAGSMSAISNDYSTNGTASACETVLKMERGVQRLFRCASDREQKNRERLFQVLNRLRHYIQTLSTTTDPFVFPIQSEPVDRVDHLTIQPTVEDSDLQPVSDSDNDEKSPVIHVDRFEPDVAQKEVSRNRSQVNQSSCRNRKKSTGSYSFRSVLHRRIPAGFFRKNPVSFQSVFSRSFLEPIGTDRNSRVLSEKIRQESGGEETTRK